MQALGLDPDNSQLATWLVSLKVGVQVLMHSVWKEICYLVSLFHIQ